MATYFHGNSEIQGGGVDGGLQTLVLMNPGYIQFSDTPPPPPPHGGNLMLLNSLAAAGNSSLASHAPLSQQFLGVPLAAEHMHGHHDVSVALHGYAPRGHYNLWNTIDPTTAARDATRATQGLSLSLPAMSGDEVRVSGGSPSSASGVTNGGGGVSGIQSVLLNSKYLRATQELLEEVVNVNNNNDVNNNNNMKKKSFEKAKVGVGESSSNGGNSGGDGSVGEGSEKRCAELSTTERQEIQMKKAKLITMLDEVEQRYRQYHNQMQIVISSFEQAAGIGSARTYTALALQTISKQFRCLKDAITGQIKAANKSLGEEDYFGGGGGKIEGSRLKYVDHHLRQQRAIQQLGMMHHNAWRPQRGLPERSVSVLRAWLFEHFLHPYPKDSDKHMLAKQTGLTRSQVSNWFINARVRLWKPMVEEMYLEEMKDHDMNNSNNNNVSEDNKSSKSNEDPNNAKNSPPRDSNSESDTKKSFNSKQENVSISTPTSQIGGNSRNNNNNNSSGFSFMGSSELLDGITQGSSPKKPRSNEIVHHSQNNNNNNNNNNEYSFINNVGNQTNFIGGFGQYPIDEIARFDAAAAENFTRFSGNNNHSNNNGVSLTLGLPHCDTFQNIQLGRRLDRMSGEQHSNEFGAVNNTQNPHHSSAAFQSMQNSKRFAAQLLPDYVA
ncbi:BEL1-like homeodomain protein 1 [Arachis hypogaea]|uniref:BEL1-like homeodomain protein 1 n=1 Tax=Arachis hypogaea TaxID=3818 RepID=UPI000DED0354|nr:BEL1-like homeodomain protein 1 [Arachis hypogaea]XP_025634824.1 BEL1-like homeodomain protein 1 [Arachis hypogaea]XP_025634825.1 BEL1-like homeodomain protein 1 [Arachis hypogaea]XP_025634826.1 BEL1-like homeodomain protein 1 [Arachis hypogaea]XP_025634827.1 BEL1-like homeodomain protein 1 [Arachis hypogaea]XP_025662105.1 BEL1-like homeodomain protein 1 [Arachis hypogaea]XP_025662110.1 BEL1-like homeodomain protein 1 [Arachis hypogaea]XP_025662117.1 BEL1-like homeodomain protein 1 [Arach